MDFLTFFHSLEEDLEEVQKDRWINVTYKNLKLKCSINTLSEGIAPGTRNSRDPIHLFKMLFSPEICSFLADSFTNSIPTSPDARQSRFEPFSAVEIYQFIGSLLQVAVEPPPTLKAGIRSSKSLGMSKNRWETIRRGISYNPSKLFTLLNDNFKKHWKPGGVGSLDETIWPWKGKHPRTVFIERKPNPSGFKVLTLCFQSTRTSHPYCYHFVPDILESLSVANILHEFHQVLPSPTRPPITADSWFGNLGWLESSPNHFTTFAMKKKTCSHLFRVITHNLKPNEFRVFTNGKVVVSVFHSEAIMRRGW